MKVTKKDGRLRGGVGSGVVGGAILVERGVPDPQWQAKIVSSAPPAETLKPQVMTVPLTTVQCCPIPLAPLGSYQLAPHSHRRLSQEDNRAAGPAAQPESLGRAAVGPTTSTRTTGRGCHHFALTQPCWPTGQEFAPWPVTHLVGDQKPLPDESDIHQSPLARSKVTMSSRPSPSTSARNCSWVPTP